MSRFVLYSQRGLSYFFIFLPCVLAKLLLVFLYFKDFCIQHPCSSQGLMEIFVFYEMVSDHSSLMESSLCCVIRQCLERRETVQET